MPKQSDRSIDILSALLAGLLALVLYLATLAPGVLGGDSGEFQFAAWLAGFVHPTGYPLYLILGNIWSHLLPLHDAAWRMNAFSALWGGMAVGLAYLLARRSLRLIAPINLSTTGQRLLAWLAALTFAVTPTFWSQAVVAEVYSLHAVFVIGVFLGLVTWLSQPAETRENRPLYWTAALYGLSLAHHRSMLLLAPAIALFLWQGMRHTERWQRHAANLARALPLVLVPLLLYLYIPLRAPAVPYARLALSAGESLQLYEPTFAGFIAHVSGQIFSSEIGQAGEAATRLGPAVRWLAEELTWAGVALGLAGLLWLGRRSRPLLTLTALSFAAVVLFNLFYGIGDIRVFYIPAYFIWSLWITCGVAALAAQVARASAWRNRPAVPFLLFALLALTLPGWLLLARYGTIDQSQNRQMSQAWRSILAEPLPANAILVSNDRDDMTPLWYYQYVDGIRPDLAGLFPLIQPDPQWADVGQVVDSALRTGRPVFLVKPMPGLEIKFDTEPAGMLVRLVGTSIAGPPSHESDTVYADAVRLSGYDIDPKRLQGGEEASITLHWQPLHRLDRDYTTFVHVLNADGEVVGQSDHLPGGVYYPSTYWREGELLRDQHQVTLAPDLGRGPYSLLVGLYTSGAELTHLGSPQVVAVMEQE